jgi:predicted Fe-Mo cluster-binding NifX family protein
MKRRAAGILFLKEFQMNLAVITDDGKTISQHFGRALNYLVLTIEDGKITQRELRSKLGHNHLSGEAQHEHHGEGHGMDPASHNRHAQMANAIADCQVILCGGMGMGAYQSMAQLNIKPIVTEIRDIEAAAQAYIEGKIIDHTEMLH